MLSRLKGTRAEFKSSAGGSTSDLRPPVASFSFLPAPLLSGGGGTCGLGLLSLSLLSPSDGLALGGTVQPESREVHTTGIAILAFRLLGLAGEAGRGRQGEEPRSCDGAGRSQAGTAAAGGRARAGLQQPRLR